MSNEDRNKAVLSLSTRAMQLRLLWALNLLGCKTPSDLPINLTDRFNLSLFVRGAEKLVKRCGEEYVRRHKQLYLDELEYMDHTFLE